MSTPKCPIEATLALIKGKWKLLIIKELLVGVIRFNELARNIPNISAKVLTQQLRELEKNGLVERHVFAEVPPHVEYRLTQAGQDIISIFKEIKYWALLHLNDENNISVQCTNCIECEEDNS